MHEEWPKWSDPGKRLAGQFPIASTNMIIAPAVSNVLTINKAVTNEAVTNEAAINKLSSAKLSISKLSISKDQQSRRSAKISKVGKAADQRMRLK